MLHAIYGEQISVDNIDSVGRFGRDFISAGFNFDEVCAPARVLIATKVRWFLILALVTLLMTFDVRHRPMCNVIIARKLDGWILKYGGAFRVLEWYFVSSARGCWGIDSPRARKLGITNVRCSMGKSTGLVVYSYMVITSGLRRKLRW